MKTTRKSFSRKSILVIVSIFLAISLTATGFAAWLISNDAGDKADGNVNVSNVSDQILGVTVETIAETVKFAPKETDKTGNIRAEDYTEQTEDKNKDVENLKFNVKGTIKRFQTLEKMEVTVKCSDDILKAAGYTWNNDENPRVYTYNAATAFIALPEFAMDKDGKPLPLATGTTKAEEILPDNSIFTAGTADNEKKFTYEVSFGWGALFENNNPGRYLDLEDGLTISETNKTNLLAVANDHKGTDKTEDYTEIDAYAKRDILNYMYSLVNKAETTNAPATATYTVVINAKAK
ncbi:MAG: hypothetical protein PUJ49_04555 [bacterium]|nr:hypothetical protein [bacterium]